MPSAAQLPNPAGAAKAHGAGLSPEAVADRLRAIASEIETGQVKAEKTVISIVTEAAGAERTTVTIEFTRRS